MGERPWYKRYPSDFIAGTMDLSLEDKGAYSIVLDLIYDHGKPIPDNARWIAGVCGCSVRRWNAIRLRLIKAGKIMVVGGLISNFRAEKQLENGSKTHRKLSESGRTGGLKRAENARALKENNNIVQAAPKAKLKHRARVQRPDTRYQKKRTPKPPSGASVEKEAFDRFWEVWPHKVGKAAAVKAWSNALKAAGDVEAITAGVLRYIDAKPADRQWMNPATFLNQERWNDQPAPSVGARSGNAYNDLERMIENGNAIDSDDSDKPGGSDSDDGGLATLPAGSPLAH